MSKDSNIKKEILKMFNEANNPRNDGWYQKHYLDQLIDIKELINSLEIDQRSNSFDNNNEPEFSGSL